MLIIVDKKIPAEAKARLLTFGELLELETDGITYPAISGHPDIFFAEADHRIVAAPNLPDKFKRRIIQKGIDLIAGENPVGEKYPESAVYNAVIRTDYCIHNQNITDPAILAFCEKRKLLHVNQGYTRCNLIFPDNEHAITSDPAIYAALMNQGVETLFVHSAGISLPGFPNGFFGGCCGVLLNKFFVLGNLDKYRDGNKVRQFAAKINMQIIELCDTPLFDGGGIIFVSQTIFSA